MRWDPIAFLTRNNIWYKTSGKDVKKGNANIRCPFCIEEGRPDETGHLGIDLKTGMWGCWRSSRHRGASPVRLIMKLSGCSKEEAQRICGESPEAKGFSGGLSFDEIDVSELFSPKEEVQQSHLNKKCKFEEGIYPLVRKYSTQRFYDYLARRGFYEEDLDDIVETYRLHYALSGPYANRVILPVYYDGVLQAYTGRAVNNSTLRYFSSKVADSVVNIYDCLPGLDFLKSSKDMETLFVVEGPLDYLKVDYYAREYRSTATCLFTKVISDIQVNLLNSVSKNFKRIVIMLDPEEFRDAFEMREKISFMRCDTSFLTISEAEDPGALTPRQVKKICRNFL